jgi:hypothetical protein
VSVLRLGAAALLVALGSGCACHERRPPADGRSEAAAVGTYRGVIDAGDGKHKRIRLLLWAGLPDRVHAELSPPVGGPDVIVDGGGGRLAVTVVSERTAYVGAASRAAIEAIAGVPVALDELVRWILVSAESSPPGIEVTRRPEREGGLPESLEIRADGRALRLERRRLDVQRTMAAGAGTGAPPPGVVERPIEELPRVTAETREGGERERP